MKSKNCLDTIITTYTRWLLRHHRLVIVLSFAIVLGLGAGMRYFVLNNDYEVFFEEDDPRVTAYQVVQEEYTRDDTVFFIVTARDGEVFDRRVLQAVAYLSEEAWQLPYATRVDSLTTFHHAWADGDDLLVAPLVDDPSGMSESALVAARDTALNEPLLRNRLIRADSPVTGVNVTVALPDGVPRVSIQITRAAEALMAETMALYPEVSIRLTGLVPLNSAFLITALQDLTRLVPIMTIIILVTMVILLKSVYLTMAVTVVVLMASLSSVGLLSWLGYEVSGPIIVLPLIVLTLAVANCVHILVSMQTGIRNGLDKPAAVIESMRVNVAPVSITSLTTAIGFLCMNATPSPNLRLLGNFTAFGVLVALWLALFLLPALVHVLPFRVRARNSDVQVRTIMEALGEFVLKYKRFLLFAMPVLTIALVVYIPTIEVNNQLVEWFEEGYPIRRDSEYAMEHLTGIYHIVLSVPAKEEGGVNEPEYLAHLDAFAQWLGKQDGIVHVSSITDTMKRINCAMHGDDPAWRRLPDSRALAAQYLLLYEMSLPPGMELNTEVNMDKSASRIVATATSLHSHEMTALVADIEQWQRDHLPEYMFAPALGPAVLLNEMAQKMMRSMVISAPLAILLVSLVLTAALRSVKYGLISLAPNLMPLGIGFGIWAYFGWTLNFNMTTIVAMSVGIVVDDTVHFMSKYLRARRELALGPDDGIRYAFASVGKAMWVTSFVLVAGFSVMTLSPKAYSTDMGTLTGIIVMAALLGDFLLLPSILVYTDGAREKARATLEEVGRKEKAIAVET